MIFVTVPRQSLRYKYTSAPQLYSFSSCYPYAPYRSLSLTTHKCYEALTAKKAAGLFLNSVFFPLILDIKFVGRTSRGHTGGRSHRISHPPSFCGACLSFSREKDSAIPFPRRPRSRILCTNDLIVLHPLGIFLFVFVLFFSEKNPVCRDRTHVPTCQRVTRYL